MRLAKIITLLYLLAIALSCSTDLSETVNYYFDPDSLTMMAYLISSCGMNHPIRTGIHWLNL
jgi:hypothetical protein